MVKRENEPEEAFWVKNEQGVTTLKLSKPRNRYNKLQQEQILEKSNSLTLLIWYVPSKTTKAKPSNYTIC